MLGLAAIPLGLDVRFLDPKADACAGAVGPLTVGALDDAAAVTRLATGADVVTYEWEGVPAESARVALAQAPVRPSERALAVSQDRLAEKQAFRDVGIPTSEFAAVDSRADLHAAMERLGLPLVVKTRRGGYDGKGQAVLRSPTEADRAWERLGSVACIAEAWVPFDREVSILAVRGVDGDTRAWPLVENVHEDGILRRSTAPAPRSEGARQREAESLAAALLADLDYVGVLAIELFQVGDRLLAGEMAPRVHNSGHWTIEGAVTSQFENHLRAVCGFPLGSTDPVGVSVMVNCLGALPPPAGVLAVHGAHLHDYRKAAAPKRKVGHVTVVADTHERAAALAADVERVIRAAETETTEVGRDRQGRGPHGP
jgi:5-(carboxyamino)imidazole ribonucleotide synthase